MTGSPSDLFSRSERRISKQRFFPGHLFASITKQGSFKSPQKSPNSFPSTELHAPRYPII